jgi:choice-of-anchor C domain-containing protein
MGRENGLLFARTPVAERTRPSNDSPNSDSAGGADRCGAVHQLLKRKAKMKRMNLALAVLALLLGCAGGARANIITNGSFEKGTVDPGGFFVYVGPGDSTSITGWTVGGNGVDYIGGLWPASDGKRSLDMSSFSAGSISQVLATTIGAAYQIQFDLSGNSGGGNVVKTLDVSVDTTVPTTGIYTYDTTGHPSGTQWLTKEFDFTATGTSTTLTFTSQEFNFYGPALDNVRGDQANSAVPEPATLTMLGFGVAGLLGYGWRKRKQASPVAG